MRPASPIEGTLQGAKSSCYPPCSVGAGRRGLLDYELDLPREIEKGELVLGDAAERVVALPTELGLTRCGEMSCEIGEIGETWPARLVPRCTELMPWLAPTSAAPLDLGTSEELGRCAASAAR